MVLYETTRGVQRVAVCSAEAAALGVRMGRPLAEVKAASGFAGADCQWGMANGQWQMEPYDPPADLEALQRLAEGGRRFSPTVGVEPGERPECLLLDISRVAPRLGGETALAEQLVRHFTRRGLTVRLGIADTIGAAWAAAHYGRGQEAEDRGEDCGSGIGNGKLQVDEGPPAGECGSRNPARQFSIFDVHSAICNLSPGEHPAALGPLPVEALRLSGEIAAILHQLGIDRIGQLEALPRAELSSRFPPELLKRLDQATGRLAEAIPGHQAATEFQAGWSPEHPLARRETIETVLEQLIRDLCGQLVRHGRGAVQLECRLICPPRESVRVAVGLFEPSTAWNHLFGLVALKLERLRLPGPVTAIRVSATATAPLVYEQQELFPREGCLSQGVASSGGRGGHWRRRRLAELVDRLSSRLGRQAVAGVRLLADAQPELTWSYDPMVERFSRRMSRAVVRAKPGLPPRPLRLRRRAPALAVTSMSPDRLGQGGGPVRFLFRGRQHRVARCWGPERIETGWWRGRAVGRDYYRVETTRGHHFWLFRRLRDGKWFLHGMFE